MRNKLNIMLILLLPIYLHAQRISVKKVTTKNVDDIGLFYALPKTIVKVDIEVKKTVKTKGVFEDSIFAVLDTNILNINGITPIDTDTTLFSIGKISITTLSELDTSQVYKIDIKRKWNKNVSTQIKLSRNSVIQGAAIESEDKTLEIISTGVSSIGSIAASFAGFRGKEESDPSSRFASIVKQITDLQKQRNSLIASNRFNGSLEVLNKLLEENDKKIDELLKVYFLGYQKQKSFTYSFYFLPEELKKTQKLLTLDPKKGIRITNFSFLRSVKKEFHNDQIKTGTDYKINIEEVSSVAKVITVKPSSTTKRKGLCYRIPAVAEVKVIKSDSTLVTRQKVMVAQLGKIMFLPYKLNQAEVEMYEDLGSIKVFTGASKAIVTSDYENLVNKLNETKEKFKKKSELEKLQEENLLLEEQKKNKELKKELSN